MKSKIKINLDSKVPLYKQIMHSLEYLVDIGEYQKGDYISSLNDLSADLNISKETVKKAYSILKKKNFLDSTQGKGYYISKNGNDKIKILLLFDKLSTYKQALFNSFSNGLNDLSEITIRLHNQDIEVFEEFLEDGLDKYNYYVITAHFPLHSDIQERVHKALNKIPNRKLVLLDHNLDRLNGNYIAVYQDKENDIYDGLMQGIDDLIKFKKLNIVILPGSLYAPYLLKGFERFCMDQNINYEIQYQISSKKIKKDEVFLVLNGQLDYELIDLIKAAKIKNYQIGRDIGIISYNESPLNEIILDGLTVLSTDFEQMGRLAAAMIMEKSFKKVRCNFRLIRRSTF